MHLNILQ